jgi:hypothetical protein
VEKLLEKHTNLMVMFWDQDVPQPRMTLCRETFVSCRRLPNNRLEIVLHHQVDPFTQQYADVRYDVGILPHNKHLLKCLNWTSFREI